MFFDVITKPQTWRNVGYLLLTFPLGIFYFVFLVTGLSLGFGLFITLLGLPILVGVLAAAYGMGEFERTTTNLLLNQATLPPHRLAVAGGLWPKVKSLVTSAETWKRVWYLLTEFVLGVVAFVLIVTTASIFALIITPFVYTRSWYQDGQQWLDEWWVIDSLGEALLVAVGAVLASLALLHVINGLARVWGEFAKAMLGPSYRQPEPAAQEPVAD